MPLQGQRANYSIKTRISRISRTFYAVCTTVCKPQVQKYKKKGLSNFLQQHFSADFTIGNINKVFVGDYFLQINTDFNYMQHSIWNNLPFKFKLKDNFVLLFGFIFFNQQYEKSSKALKDIPAEERQQRSIQDVLNISSINDNK